MEKVIYRGTLNILIHNNVLSDAQFGFKYNRSILNRLYIILLIIFTCQLIHENIIWVCLWTYVKRSIRKTEALFFGNCITMD